MQTPEKQVTPTLTVSQALEQGYALHCRGDLAAAERLYASILAVEPGNADALHLQGVLRKQQGRLDEALRLIGAALDRDPDYVEAHVNLGLTLCDLKRHEEGVASYDRALAIDPDYSEAHYNKGLALSGLGRGEEAVTSYRRAVTLNPRYAEAYCNLGILLSGLKRQEEAVTDLHAALAIKPDYAKARFVLGTALKDLGRFAEAEESFRRALEIKPDYAEAHAHLGSIQQAQGRLPEAEQSYRRVLTIRADDVDAHNDLGVVLKDQGRPAEAEASYHRALAIKPDFAGAHNNLGVTLKAQGRLIEAEESYRRALAIEPAYAEVYNNLANMQCEQGRFAEAEASYRRLLDINPDHSGGRSNLLLTLNYTDKLSRAELFTEHVAWARRHEAPGVPQHRAHTNSKDQQRRLRVGYVSPDFRRHSVAYFIEALLERHDRNGFEVYCYSNVGSPDDMTRRLAALADCTRNIVGVTDTRAADLVRSDAVDILVDLAGHTANGRLGLFALKPAPVQVTYLGYPNTSGLSAVDWRLTDRLADPPGDSDEFHSERLARLPETFLCFRPSREAPEVRPAPFLTTGQVTFGSFNARQKITPEVVRTWARLLDRVAGSRLFLKAASFGDAAVRGFLCEEFARYGIASNRLTIVPWQGNFGQHLARYHEADICLDTFPYNGTTTTLEALWMGVPVVSVAGDRHAARVGLSILSNAGLGELIAGSVGEYVEIAAALAADRSRLASLRQAMRGRVAASPMMDETGFTRSLEQLYREMWRQWCTGVGPEARS